MWDRGWSAEVLQGMRAGPVATLLLPNHLAFDAAMVAAAPVPTVTLTWTRPDSGGLGGGRVRLRHRRSDCTPSDATLPVLTPRSS